MCEVGVHQNECGGVVHHGDSLKKLLGKSFEAITLEKIGQYDYLVYINTFIQNLEEKIKNKKIPYASNVSKSKPVIKYYTSS